MRAILLSLLLPSLAEAATLTVGPGQTHEDVGSAVGAAQPGDTVVVQAGTYTVASPIVVDEAITLRASGAVILKSGGIDLLHVTAGPTTLEGLDLRPYGGRGVRASGGQLTLRDLSISGNDTIGNADGAAILVESGATVTIDGGSFYDNDANSGSVYTLYHGGCLAVTGGEVTVTGAVFTRCRAGHGGAISVRAGRLVVTDTQFVHDHAIGFGAGGALHVAEGAEARVEDSTFLENKASYAGGAIAAKGAVTVRRSLFQRNQAGVSAALSLGWGGALYTSCEALDCPDVTVEDSVFVGNGAIVDGGALGLSTAGAVTVRRTVLCGNLAGGRGGAAWLGSPTTSFTLTNTIFAENTAGSTGGALQCDDGATGGAVVNNHFLGNAFGAGGQGVRLTGCTTDFRNNLVMGHQGVGVTAGDGGSYDYNAWYGNTATLDGRALGAADLRATDPRLTAWSRDGNCANDDWRPLGASPLLDRGDPALKDPDGTRSDIGAWGGPHAPLQSQEDADGDGVPASRDCDDDDPNVAPGKPEVCNGVDDDCDGEIDLPAPASAPTVFLDEDGDGHGVPGTTRRACDVSPGWAAVGDDCDDTDPTTFPGAVEVCDGVDNDCDDLVDDDDPDDLQPWYPDRDGDGYGRPVANPPRSCEAPEGTVANADDCDDAHADIHPAAAEVCDGVDQDCNGLIDDDPPEGLLFFPDLDGDGWGDPAGAPVESCRAPEGHAIHVGDCDDGDPDVHPLAPEPCDPPRDLNCDGASGYDDHDGDGYPACQDCDDFDSSARPGAEDPWYDGRVQDCDRTSDFDRDGDGFDASVGGGDDCDDDDPSVHPGAHDPPGDGLDADCDGRDGAEGDTGEGGGSDDDDDDDDDEAIACSGCDQRGGAGLLWWLPLGIVARRRRAARHDARARSR